MKKIIFFISIFYCSILSYSQDIKSNNKEFKNEISVDLTPMVRQFFKVKDQYFYYYTNPYYLMYRRHFNEWAIRTGIGGRFRQSGNVGDDDTQFFISRTFGINFRLGLEKKIEFSKKWQVFYGCDLWTSINNYYNENRRNQQITKSESKTKNYGITFLIGGRYRINKRLSISTKTSFQLFYYKRVNNSLYNNITTEYVDDGLNTKYIAPTLVFINFDF